MNLDLRDEKKEDTNFYLHILQDAKWMKKYIFWVTTTLLAKTQKTALNTSFQIPSRYAKNNF